MLPYGVKLRFGSRAYKRATDDRPYEIAISSPALNFITFSHLTIQKTPLDDKGRQIEDKRSSGR